MSDYICRFYVWVKEKFTLGCSCLSKSGISACIFYAWILEALQIDSQCVKKTVEEPVDVLPTGSPELVRQNAVSPDEIKSGIT